ncbi:hypothetical protein C8P69_105123 [Phreatobacter oligotrophus]|jgi:hypothetical protein|uniref:Uncharacterized protein n=2 Tax=Phreatobacter oligotrophus TaxID=1122261 RepID=A0A2T4Z2J1_9HYPH|nr:hypothetical protein [Phreatobacter oligotrophus]MBX9991790.1 hypothetical protein [Phreatobacter oligotrophus]PTM54973.1 hypothetical protein C8P69_105123 [Phreatobacter oligotrophus]
MDHAARMPASSRSRRMDRIEFRLLMLASFPFFLCVTAIARLRGERTVSPESLSLFAEARAAAASAIPFAFMG